MSVCTQINVGRSAHMASSHTAPYHTKPSQATTHSLTTIIASQTVVQTKPLTAKHPQVHFPKFPSQSSQNIDRLTHLPTYLGTVGVVEARESHPHAEKRSR